MSHFKHITSAQALVHYVVEGEDWEMSSEPQNYYEEEGAPATEFQEDEITLDMQPFGHQYCQCQTPRVEDIWILDRYVKVCRECKREYEDVPF